MGGAEPAKRTSGRARARFGGGEGEDEAEGLDEMVGEGKAMGEGKAVRVAADVMDASSMLLHADGRLIVTCSGLCNVRPRGDREAGDDA